MEAGKEDWKPRTVTGYASVLDNYWKPELGHLRLQRITPSMIASCYSKWRAERDITGGTLLNVHRCLHRALKVAVLWGYLPNNPADRVEPPKARRRRPSLWSPEETRRLLESSEGDRWHVVWSMSLGTGCRLGEVLGLRWPDMDFAASALMVQRAVSRPRSAAPVIVLPKYEASVRSIQLPRHTATALREWKGAQAVERLRFDGAWVAGDSIVTREDGTQPTPSAIRWAFNRACRDTGLHRIRIHDLRHLSASLLLSEGVPLPIVSARLGHSTPAITAAIYSHALGNEDARAATALDSALGH
jgi:integrase